MAALRGAGLRVEKGVMSTFWRVALTTALLIIASVAGIAGVFSPLLSDDPSNTSAAVTAMWVCAAIVVASGFGIVMTWWRRKKL
jgi:Na+-driven multidrug efflux pump